MASSYKFSTREEFIALYNDEDDKKKKVFRAWLDENPDEKKRGANLVASGVKKAKARKVPPVEVLMTDQQKEDRKEQAGKPALTEEEEDALHEKIAEEKKEQA